MSLSLKQGLHWAGGALAFAGIVFVLLRLRSYGSEIDFTRFNWIEWLAIAVLSFIYGLSSLMLAMAWWNLLRKFGTDTTYRWAIWTYGISQLAKYVPGNIFHLAGRQAIGMADGFPGWPLAKSTIWELGLVTLAGAVLGIFALPLVDANISLLNVGISFFVVAIAVASLLGFYATMAATKAFAWYLLFFSISSALFVGLIQIVSPLSLPNVSLWFAMGGAYILAWMAGFLTPGAPAGLGVREFVVLFLLQGQVAGADLLLVVLLGRAVSVCGDLLFFVFASLIGKRNTVIV